MRSTVFSCGVLYERFARGGLASVGIGSGSVAQQQGAYLMDVEHSTAEIVERHASGQPIYLCMTSVNDVAKFVVAALDLDPHTWLGEFRMYGDRRTVAEVVRWAEAVKGGEQFFLLPLKHHILTIFRGIIRHHDHRTGRSGNTPPACCLLPGLCKSRTYARAHSN
jgi:hypothetical protein